MKPAVVTVDDLCVRGPDGSRAVAGAHLAGCDDDRCRGCQPCVRSHCVVCRDTHAATICPVCLGLVRADLHALVQLSSGLTRQARNGGHDGHLSASTWPILGGDAMVLAGPSANYDAYTDRKIALAALPDKTLIEEYSVDDLDGDPEPVAYTLATLEWMYRQGMPARPADEPPSHTTRTCGCPPPRPHTRHDPDRCCLQCQVDASCVLGLMRTRFDDQETVHDRPDLARAFRFLDDNLAELAAVTMPAFDDVARDLKERRRRLEAVLYAGDRVVRGTVCCPRCDVAYVRHFEPKHPCDCDPQIHQQHGGWNGDWECPRCDNSIDHDEYIYELGRDYRDNATHLPTALLEDRTGIAAATVRQWARQGHVGVQGDDSYGRQAYSVADVAHHAHQVDACGCPPMRPHGEHLRLRCCIQCHSNATCRLGPYITTPTERHAS